MEPVYYKLPIRLAPTSSIALAVILGLFAAAGIVGILAVNGQIGALDFASIRSPAERTIGFIVFGGITSWCLWVAFKLVAMLVPGSPLCHLQVSAKGIVERDFLRTRAYAWPDLSGFRVVTRTKIDRDRHSTSKTYYYYVNAVSPELADKLLDDDPFYAQPILSIHAHDYGEGDPHFDAQNMAIWLNGVREMALKGELKDGDSLTPPAGFESVTLSVATKDAAAPDRAPSVIQRQ